MSSTSQPTEDTEYTPWDELTTARQRIVLTIAHVHGPATFNRPDLRDDVEDSSTIEGIVDKDQVLTSLKYTRLLNALEEEDGYLIKEFQGGTNPIILDIEYDSDRDTRNGAPFGDASALHTLVDQVCDREGITRDLLNEVDNKYDFNEVKDKVNSEVGRRVLRPYSDPSRYKFTKETYGLVREKAKESDGTGE